jgi:hypothetical protein
MAKRVIDLTTGGTCELCRPQGICAGCGKGFTESEMYYAQTGDHDHLVMKDGRLGREAYGQAMCGPCYNKDYALVYPSEPVPVAL